MARAIGIDLGTSYTCAAVFQNGQVKIIANDRGNHTTPTVVAFTETERLFGEDAVDQIAWNSSNTLFNIKRLIGRQFNDIAVQEDKQNLSYKIVNDDDRIKIPVQFKGELEQFLPEQVSAMVLWKMKKLAEVHLGEEVENAVITVPAYFNDAQKTATKNAGRIAGLNVMRIINEPTAAALAYSNVAYGLNKSSETTTNALVFDLGGGTFDVSVLEITDQVIEVKATSGNNHLGGEDFNNMMVKYFAKEFHQKYGKDIRTNARALRRLTVACEKAKRALSSETEAVIELDSLVNDIDFYTSITRKKFEELCNDLFNSTLQSVEDALLSSQKSKDSIKEVILVGGSTKIPKIQSLLRNFFNGKRLNKSINPDESVAYGAAIQAAILNKELDDSLNDILLLDVTPLSLGMENIDGRMINFIKRNTLVPKKEQQIWTTKNMHTTSCIFNVCEGERYLAKENNLLGCFDFKGLAESGENFKVIFDLDEDGILKVSGTVVSSGDAKEIMIKRNSRTSLADEEIIVMVKEAEKMKLSDTKEINRIQARNSLQHYCQDVELFLENRQAESTMSKITMDRLSSMCKAILEWIATHQGETENEFSEKMKVVADFFNKLEGKVGTETVKENLPPPIQESTVDELLKQGNILMNKRKKTKEDVKKAREYYTRAALNASAKKKYNEMMIAHQKLGISFMAEADIRENKSYLKWHYIHMAAMYLGKALIEGSIRGLLKDRKWIAETIDAMNLVITEFFEKIVPCLADESKWGKINSFVGCLGMNRFVSQYDWKVLVVEARISQAELMFELVMDHMKKKSYKPAIDILHDVDRILKEADEVCPVDSAIKKRCEILIQDYSIQIRVAKANLCYEEVEQSIAAYDDNTSFEKKVDLTWSALDKIKEAQNLIKDYDVEMLCKAVVKEGILYLKYLKNKSRAQKSFEKMIAITSENQLGDFPKREWYIEANRYLQNIQDELDKEENDKKQCMDDMEQDIGQLKGAHTKAKSEKCFIDFLFSKMPPKHRANYINEKPQCGYGDEKFALRKLLVYYHPDKISKTKFGMKYYYICQEITKILTQRYEKY